MNFFKSIGVLLLLLSFLTHAQPADQQPENKNTSANMQQQLWQLKHQQQLQSHTIKSAQDKVDDALKHLDLRQDILDDRSSSIDWWLTVVGIFLAVFGVFGIIVARDKLKEFDELNQKAKRGLEEIQQHTATAQQDADEINQIKADTKKQLSNPKVEITPETKKEVKASGTKLQKLFLAARQQTDYKQAIGLWKDIITIANYEKDREILSSGYSNLAYAYDELEAYPKAIAAYQKAIEIKPDFHEAYYNMGSAYDELKDYPKVIAAYQKAIEIKPDFHEAYYNMGSAYNKSADYPKAIAAYHKAIEIKPDFHKAYVNLFELQLVQGQDFDQHLAQQFKTHCNADKTAKIQFEMLTIFKLIDNNEQAQGWQQAFSQTYQDVSFGGWGWKEIEDWINKKSDSVKKQALQSALEFFKGQ